MINEKIKKILQHRGYTTDDDINKFLYPKIEYLQNPYLLKWMEEAITTICDAIKENNKILIYNNLIVICHLILKCYFVFDCSLGILFELCPCLILTLLAVLKKEFLILKGLLGLLGIH